MKPKPFPGLRLGWLIACVVSAFGGGCAYLETKQGDWIFNPAQGGFGKSTFVDGGSPSEQSADEDAEAAWRYLAARSPDAKRFITAATTTSCRSQ